MKLANANAFRARAVRALYDLKASEGEDVGFIASNAFNFPIVVDGEEGWCEITVKVTKDGGDEGYGKREEYALKLRERAEKAKAAAELKAKKVAKDAKRRAEKGK